MKRISVLVTIVLVVVITNSSYRSNPTTNYELRTINYELKTINSDTILFAGEKHFANVQQLTFGGDNAEAYFSFDSKYLIFQRKNEKAGIPCDQIWMGKIPTAPGE